jgi:hypothetical protein
MTPIYYNINEENCINFLCKYGKGELTNSIKRFCDLEGNYTLLERYQKWINWKNLNQIGFGGVREHLICERFNIDSVIFHYDWCNVEGQWSEIFQYVYNINH